MKEYFTNEDLDGFKGVIHKADVVLGIGRKSPKESIFTIFSIKSRHSKNFELKYSGDLEFMTFLDEEPDESIPTDEHKLPQGQTIPITATV